MRLISLDWLYLRFLQVTLQILAHLFIEWVVALAAQWLYLGLCELLLNAVNVAGNRPEDGPVILHLHDLTLIPLKSREVLCILLDIWLLVIGVMDRTFDHRAWSLEGINNWRGSRWSWVIWVGIRSLSGRGWIISRPILIPLLLRSTSCWVSIVRSPLPWRSLIA